MLVDEPTRIETYSRVDLDTGSEDFSKLDIVESWLHIWCQCNCHGSWIVERAFNLSKGFQFHVYFDDPNEAMIFKLNAIRFYIK